MIRNELVVWHLTLGAGDDTERKFSDSTFSNSIIGLRLPPWPIDEGAPIRV
jgi:hypothetical protein